MILKKSIKLVNGVYNKNQPSRKYQRRFEFTFGIFCTQSDHNLPTPLDINDELPVIITQFENSYDKQYLSYTTLTHAKKCLQETFSYTYG